MAGAYGFGIVEGVAMIPFSTFTWALDYYIYVGRALRARETYWY